MGTVRHSVMLQNAEKGRTYAFFLFEEVDEESHYFQVAWLRYEDHKLENRGLKKYSSYLDAKANFDLRVQQKKDRGYRPGKVTKKLVDFFKRAKDGKDDLPVEHSLAKVQKNNEAFDKLSQKRKEQSEW